MRSSVSSSFYFYQCEFQLADHQYIHNLAIFFPRTVLITTYLSSLQIPKENKSWVDFTSKKNLPPCYFFFLLNLSPRISWGISNLGSTKKIQASSGVSLVDGSDGSDCGSDFQHGIWCALNFSVAKYLEKTILKKIWWEIVHKSVNLDTRLYLILPNEMEKIWYLLTFP